VQPYGSVTIAPTQATPTQVSSWGRVKTMYR